MATQRPQLIEGNVMAKKTQQARVLGGFELDGVKYNSNDVIESDPVLIRSLGTAVDTTKEAVDYCLNLEEPIVKRHEFKRSEQPAESQESAGTEAAAEAQENQSAAQ